MWGRTTVKALEQINHPGVAAFVADTSFREGQTGFGLVQEAINTVRKEQGLPTIDVTTVFDGDTLDALKQVTGISEGRQLFARTLKKLRDDKHIRSPNYVGEELRTRHFVDLIGQRR